MNDIETHIRQTNERLACIKQHLATPQGFQNAARELLDWCSDPRAFQSAFENGLMSCLTVVTDVVEKPGYDLELGYRLLAMCSSNRDKFTPKSSGLLEQWSNDLSQLLLMRHHKTRGDSASAPGDTSWHGQSPAGQPGQGQQQLSVVTTVWAGGPGDTGSAGAYGASQAGNSGSAYHPPPHPSSSQPGGPPPAYPAQPPGAGVMAKRAYGGAPGQPPGVAAGAGMYHHRGPANGGGGGAQSMYGGGGAGRGAVGGGGGGGYPHYPPGGAGGPPQNHMGSVNAAAFAAAAATATATATATASYVAIEQQQQINGHMPGRQPQLSSGQYANYPPGTGPQRSMMRPMGPHAGRMKGAAGGYPMHPNRSAPYPPGGMSAAAYGAYAKRGMMPTNEYGQIVSNGAPYNGPQGPYPGGMMSEQALSPPAYQQRLSGPPAYPQQRPPVAYGSMASVGAVPPQQGFPGTPTPPVTPGSGVPVGYPPGGGAAGMAGPPPMPPGVGAGNCPPVPPQPIERAELRLTFPIRDGTVMQPFRLEHNLAVSNHWFQLSDHIFQTLVSRGDLELQLKCYHHEDPNRTTWPQSAGVSVNNQQVGLERGGPDKQHRPLLLKRWCQPGRNTIQISVCECCCSHLFHLQLVHRPSVRSVVQGLLKKRLLPHDACVEKIKKHFQQSQLPDEPASSVALEQTAYKMSLKCPITLRRIDLPARGQDCRHIQCFDLRSYLQLNADRPPELWRCPVCARPAVLEGLEIDQYIWGLLGHLSGQPHVEEVTFDPTARCRPVGSPQPHISAGAAATVVKSEQYPLDAASECSRFMLSSMSPSSVPVPTPSSYEVNSPYTPATPQGASHLPGHQPYHAAAAAAVAVTSSSLGASAPAASSMNGPTTAAAAADSSTSTSQNNNISSPFTSPPPSTPSEPDLVKQEAPTTPQQQQQSQPQQQQQQPQSMPFPSSSAPPFPPMSTSLVVAGDEGKKEFCDSQCVPQGGALQRIGSLNDFGFESTSANQDGLGSLLSDDLSDLFDCLGPSGDDPAASGTDEFLSTFLD